MTTCWVVTERGLTGTENQCLGVAQALGLTPVLKRISLREPWRTFSPYIRIANGMAFDRSSDKLEAPWPDLLIASGRKSVAASLFVKKMSGGKTFTVQVQDPRVSRNLFDLVAVPAHDPMRGPNVIVTDAAPNRITAQRLVEAAHRFENVLAHLPRPRVAVLIGGNSKVHSLTPTVMGDFGETLRKLAENGAGLMVTASRRTGDENLQILQAWLKDTGAYVWDGKGENPYEAFLADADHIIVTADSVSMASEAATTGKPVYRVDLLGGSKRFDAFHRHLEKLGVTKPFDGTLDCWPYQPLNDAQKVADAIRARAPHLGL